MKILILASASILICLNIFAQDVQPCQFIGLYASNNKKATESLHAVFIKIVFVVFIFLV